MARPVPKKIGSEGSKLIKTPPPVAPGKELAADIWVDGYSSKGTYLVVARKQTNQDQYISVRHISGALRVHVHPSMDWLSMEIGARGVVAEVYHRPSYTRIWLKPQAFANQYANWLTVRGLYVMDWEHMKTLLGLQTHESPPPGEVNATLVDKDSIPMDIGSDAPDPLQLSAPTDTQNTASEDSTHEDADFDDLDDEDLK
jgi:hypothetical protein